MAYTIEQVEDAVISAIEAIDAVTLRTVKTYGGEFDEDDIRRLAAPLPAVYVLWGGSRYAAHGPRKIETISFHVLACDKGLRSEAEARRGGTQNPGTYAILAAVRDVLCGRQLSLDIDPIELVREDHVFTIGAVCCYGAEYQTAQGHLYTGA